MLRHITLASLLLAIAPLSQAADNGIYLGAGYAQSEYGLSNPLDANEFDDEDSGYKLIAGFRPLDSFGVEMNYIDHGNATVPAGVACIQVVGEPCPDTSKFNATTLSAFAVGYIDFPVIDLFGKVGATSWQFDASSTPAFPDFNVDESDIDFDWGLGVQARFGSLGARLEYESFKIIEDEEIGTVSLSFTYTFL